MPGDEGTPKDAPHGKEEIELFVADLEKVLGIELDRRRAWEVEDTLDEAAVLAEYLEGKSPAREVVEDTGMVAGYVHATTEAGKVNIDGGFLGIPA